ncbi:MAG: 30S ribosomal protein S16 [Planctomycetota bacterium]|jgi:small subunit ribosomal protein S16
MAVKIRMMRIGRRHRPFFRINAVESRNQRNGRILEKLGHYDPIEKDKAKQVVVNIERIKHWLDKGALPSDTVSQILLRYGIKTRHYEAVVQRRQRARAIARAAGKPFTKAERLAAENPEVAETTQAPKAAKAEEPKVEAPKAVEAKEVKAEVAETTEAPKAAERGQSRNR